jgi:hypothetical protein
MTPSRRSLLSLIATVAALLALCVAPSALGASFLTGIGDEQTEMFSDPLFLQLHTRVVRYIAPYDAVAHGDDLHNAEQWIHAAEADHLQVLVAFYHSEHTPTKLPSVASYQKDVGKFAQLFPRVHQYQSWDEANRGNIRHALTSPSAATAAKLYQALKRVCHGCTVIGLDVLDQNSPVPTIRYIKEFKREIVRLRTVMPSIWGLHNYSDVNRLESWRTRDLLKALGGQVWLTETGGIVQFQPSFPNSHGSGLTRAARVIKFTFSLAAAHHQIKRLYLYDWTGGVDSTRFDAGLMNAHDEPRAGYQVVCKTLHAQECAVKLARN